ncbi:PorV/PorQ family protein [bacterium]|nr:PorV/PorQ family protein [bacterium]MBU1753759.1 PorV/PorQ family protein [bacterium]
MKRIVFSLIMVMTVNNVQAAPIDLQIGCRPQGMGGAYVAVVDDANAVYWNPAGLINVKSKEFGFAYLKPMGVDGVSVSCSSLAVPFGNKWAIGINYLANMAKLEEGRDARYKENKMQETTLILAGAHKFTSVLSAGISVKRFGLDASLDSGGGFGCDMGLLYNYPIKGENQIGIGLLLRNFLADLKDESFPATVRFGLSSKLYNERLIVAADVNTKKGVNEKKDYSLQHHVGCEVEVAEGMWLRAGEDRGNLSAGIGFSLRNWQLDYAFNKLEDYDLDHSHRVSILMRF